MTATISAICSGSMLPQFAPIAAAPSAARTRAHSSAELPIAVLPPSVREKNAMHAITGRADTALHAFTAHTASRRSIIVSIMNPATPACTRQAACSLKASMNSSSRNVPYGSSI